MSLLNCFITGSAKSKVYANYITSLPLFIDLIAARDQDHLDYGAAALSITVQQDATAIEAAYVPQYEVVPSASGTVSTTRVGAIPTVVSPLVPSLYLN